MLENEFMYAHHIRYDCNCNYHDGDNFTFLDDFGHL